MTTSRLFSFIGSLVALTMLALVTSCTPTGDVLDEPEGGSMCFAAFDFNDEVEASVVFDGQACPTADASAGAPCGANTTDWPVALDLDDTDYDGFIEVRTKVGHYRITPPVPPTESDLYVAFEADQATVDDDVRVTVALNPSGTDTDNRAVVIKPFPDTPPTGTGVGGTADEITGYEWDGSQWVNWTIPSGAVDVSVAYDVPNQYWGVEVRVHLPAVGITSQNFYMASFWRSKAPALGGAPGQSWSPDSASAGVVAGPAANLPNGDPTTWRRYTFGEDCMPDVYINSEWNTCADIYINAEDENARVVGINNINQFHARVHGDDDAGAPTAEDVLVYMDIGHLGNGHAPYAMNYDYANANINFNGATSNLDTATPEPPTPFDVAAQATNDDVRVEWRPADETNNPFSDGEHVCVEAYVYYKDDPNFDNNFGQCNMQFVDAVEGRMQFMAATGFRWLLDQPPTQLLLVPLVVNSASDVSEWEINLGGRGIERTNAGWLLTDLPEEGGIEVDMRYAVPDRAFERPDERYYTGIGGATRRLTRKVYGERPLLIIKSFVPVTGRDEEGEPYRVLLPGSYVGLAFNP